MLFFVLKEPYLKIVSACETFRTHNSDDNCYIYSAILREKGGLIDGGVPSRKRKQENTAHMQGQQKCWVAPCYGCLLSPGKASPIVRALHCTGTRNLSNLIETNLKTVMTASVQGNKSKHTRG